MTVKDPRVLLGVYVAEVRQFCVDILFKYHDMSDGHPLVDSPDDISVRTGTPQDFKDYSSPPAVGPEDMKILIEVNIHKRNAQAFRAELKGMFNFFGEAHISRAEFEADVYAVASYPWFSEEIGAVVPQVTTVVAKYDTPRYWER